MRQTFLPGMMTIALLGTGCSMLSQSLPYLTPMWFRGSDYFPLKSGATWVMRAVPRGAAEPYFGLGSSTASVARVETTSEGRVAFLSTVTRTVAIGPMTVTQLAYSDAPGSFQVEVSESGLVTEGEGSLPGPVDQIRFTIHPEYLRYGESYTPRKVPFIFLPGQMEKMRLAATASTQSGNYRFSEILQEATIEPEITVPAGNFRDCLRLAITQSTDKADRDGGTSSTNRLVTTYWLAKGVGIVKKQVEGSATETEVLETYTMP